MAADVDGSLQVAVQPIVKHGEAAIQYIIIDNVVHTGYVLMS